MWIGRREIVVSEVTMIPSEVTVSRASGEKAQRKAGEQSSEGREQGGVTPSSVSDRRMVFHHRAISLFREGHVSSV